MFFEIFFAVLAAMLVNQAISMLGFMIWWYEPFARIKARFEPKPQATYRDNVVDFKENHNA